MLNSTTLAPNIITLLLTFNVEMVLMIRDRVVHVPDKPPKEVVTDINVLTVGRRHGAILQAYFGPFLFLLDCGIPNIAVLKNKTPEISYNDKNRLVKTYGRR